MSGGLPTPYDADIEAHIDAASALGFAALAAPGRPVEEAHHIIKYMAAAHGGQHPPASNVSPKAGLYVSNTPGFTWGPGAYVCPVAYPLSTAIYGRCGVVAELSPSPFWRLFDATGAAAQMLYVQWVQVQPLFAMLTLTAHANWANHLLRTLFRTRFRIDVVIFPPDEFHQGYTDRVHDRWLAISEWTAAGTLTGAVNASWPIDPRLTVIVSEEFQMTASGIRRRALIGPTSAFPGGVPSPTDVLNAYRLHNMLLVGP